MERRGLDINDVPVLIHHQLRAQLASNDKNPFIELSGNMGPRIGCMLFRMLFSVTVVLSLL